MSVRIFVSTLLIFVMFGQTCWAQDDAPTRGEQATAMQRFAAFTGTWEGHGSMTVGDHEVEFHSKEEFLPFAEGLAMCVRGLHTVDLHGEEPRIVHDAAGMLTYDAKAGHYRFVTHLATGRAGDYTGRFDKDGNFTWEITADRHDTRVYVITIEGDNYTEVGYRQDAKGNKGEQFFEMKLRKVAKAR